VCDGQGSGGFSGTRWAIKKHVWALQKGKKKKKKSGRARVSTEKKIHIYTVKLKG
jgi:hypothetical protein